MLRVEHKSALLEGPCSLFSHTPSKRIQKSNQIFPAARPTKNIPICGAHWWDPLMCLRSSSSPGNAKFVDFLVVGRVLQSSIHAQGKVDSRCRAMLNWLFAARGQISLHISERFFCTATPSFLPVIVRISSSFGDLCQQDMGTGLPFRPATFDGCISVSALQVSGFRVMCLARHFGADRSFRYFSRNPKKKCN